MQEVELVSARDAREMVETLLTQSQRREEDAAKWIFSLYRRYMYYSLSLGNTTDENKYISSKNSRFC